MAKLKTNEQTDKNVRVWTRKHREVKNHSHSWWAFQYGPVYYLTKSVGLKLVYERSKTTKYDPTHCVISPTNYISCLIVIKPGKGLLMNARWKPVRPMPRDNYVKPSGAQNHSTSLRLFLNFNTPFRHIQLWAGLSHYLSHTQSWVGLINTPAIPSRKLN